MYILPVSTGVQNNVNITKNNQYNQNRMSFTGEIGDKYVKKLEKGELVTNEEILDDMKGAFGFKTSIVSDVVESFVRRIKGLQSLNEQTNIALEGKTEQANAYAVLLKDKLDQEDEFITKDKILETQKAIISQQDEKIADLESRLKVFDKVGSVENLDFVSPKLAIATLDEMREHQHDANGSLLTYLMTGQGQEAFIEQLNRNRIIAQAANEGVLNIPKVSNYVEKVESKGVLTGGDPIYYIYNSVEQILKGTEEGSHLFSSKILNQVKNNVIALAMPYAGTQRTVSHVENIMNKVLCNVVDFHDNLKNGVKIKEAEIRSHKGPVNVICNTYIDYPERSEYIFVHDTGKQYHSFEELAAFGRNRNN